MRFFDLFHLLLIDMNFRHTLLGDIFRQLRLLVLLLGVSLMLGCLGEEEGVIIENPNLPTERILVGIVFISPERALQIAQVSRTQSSLNSSTSFSPVRTAKVVIWPEKASPRKSAFQFDQRKGFYTSEISILEGVEYVLNIDYQGKSLKGRCKVPQQVSAVELVQLYEEKDTEGYSSWRAKVNIQDHPEDENSYHVSFSEAATGPVKELYPYRLLDLPEDPEDYDRIDSLLAYYPDSILILRSYFFNNDRELLIKDQGREGKVLREDLPLGGSFFLFPELGENNKVQINLEVTVITSDYNYYRYLKAIDDDFIGDNNPFFGGGELTLFPRDLEGGLGMFTAYRISHYRFDLRELIQNR